MESSTYPNEKFIAKSREFVNVAAHSEKGHERDYIVGAETKKLCEHYWGITCDVHSQAYREARNKYEGISGVPCTVIADPQGVEIDRIVGGAGPGELIKKMDEALEKVPGEKIHYDAWNFAKTSVADGEKAFTAGEYKKAVTLWHKVSLMKQRPLKEMSEEPLQRAQEKGAALLEEARTLIEAAPANAKKAIKEVADNFKPLEVSKTASELLKTLK